MPTIIVQTANVTVGRTLDAIYCDGNRRLPVATVGWPCSTPEFLRKHLRSTVCAIRLHSLFSCL